MLVLSRKKNESIRIGDSIEITVLAVHCDRVRIGITAPREVPVVRSELLPIGSSVASADDAGLVVSIAEESRRDDTLSSETARSKTSRPCNLRRNRPR